MACTSVCKGGEEAEIKAFMVFAIHGWISLIELKEIFLYAFLLLLQPLWSANTMEGHEDAPESLFQSQNVVVIEKRLGTRRERRKTRIL